MTGKKRGKPVEAVPEADVRAKKKIQSGKCSCSLCDASSEVTSCYLEGGGLSKNLCGTIGLLCLNTNMSWGRKGAGKEDNNTPRHSHPNPLHYP